MTSDEEELGTKKLSPRSPSEEGGEDGPVTTVTFEEKDGKTLLVMTERYPSKEALDELSMLSNCYAIRC